MHAPPGTAVYAEMHQGWTVNDHLTTDMLECLDWLVWAKSTDAQQKVPRKKPKPRPRPGVEGAPKAKAGKPEDKPMTVADYIAKTGMVMSMEGRD